MQTNNIGTRKDCITCLSPCGCDEAAVKHITIDTADKALVFDVFFRLLPLLA
jgi:hypothetical protein